MIDPKTGNYFKKWHITYRPEGRLSERIATVYQNRKSVRNVIDAVAKLMENEPFILIVSIRECEVR